MNQREVNCSVLLHDSRSTSRFIVRKQEVYHFCPSWHASVQKQQPWAICPSPHALIWQFHPIMVRKSGGGWSLLWVAKRSRPSWPSDGCAWKADSPRLSWFSLWFIASGMFLLNKGHKDILKSFSMVPPHVISTTCCWSTEINSSVNHLSQVYNILSSLQNTNMPTHN